MSRKRNDKETEEGQNVEEEIEIRHWRTRKGNTRTWKIRKKQDIDGSEDR